MNQSEVEATANEIVGLSNSTFSGATLADGTWTIAYVHPKHGPLQAFAPDVGDAKEFKLQLGQSVAHGLATVGWDVEMESARPKNIRLRRS